MNTPDQQSAAQAVVAHMRDGIPLARAMALELERYDGEQLHLHAPLAPNVNDKGCAFGGSLASAMTLAGWALVELALRERGEDCDVFVGESTVRYLSTIWHDFRVEAHLGEGADWPLFFDTLAARGRARIEITCLVPGDQGKPAASLNARFVAKRRVSV